jgi:hypothetical protein
MSITRVGATKQYSDGWDNIFGGGKARVTTRKSSAVNSGTKSAKPKSAKKSAAAKPKKAARKKKR